MNVPVQDFSEQLKRQLAFLRNSAAAYDAGHVEEAVRIGVAIRVLLHDTKASKSLLNQMGMKDSLQLVSTATTFPDHLLVNMDFVEFMGGMTFGNDLTYDPVPSGTPTIPCLEWWTQPVFLRDKVTYSRRDVVLAAANKDGGAHVDTPDAKLLALHEGFWMRTSTAADGTPSTTPLVNNHFRMLRRFADELLSSQELLALA